jgi:hypothetical protein
MRNRRLDELDKLPGIREMSDEEVDKIAATGYYTSKLVMDTEADVKLKETKTLLKMFRLIF